MLSTLRTLLCFVSVSLCVSCTSIQPVHVDVPHSAQPIFEAVAIEGLVVEDERAVGRSVDVSSNFGSVHSTTWANGMNPVYTNDYMNSTTVNNQTHYERFASYEVQDMLKRLVEDCGVSRSVMQDADVIIEGRRVSGGPSTGIGRMTWNLFNTFGPGLVGGPYLGTAEATVELRVYYQNELLGTFEGQGDATWSSPAYGILRRLSRVKLEATNVATKSATRAALANMIRHLQEIGVAETNDDVATSSRTK